MAVKVGIVGMFGNLGSRLAVILSQDPDFELAVGVVQPDNNLIRAISALKTQPKLKSVSWAKKMFLTGKHQNIKQWNKGQSLVEFIPADQLSLKKECDAVIVVTNFGSNQLLAQYKTFGGPVILQSEAKEGKLISPPLVSRSFDNLYRQGDCLLHALVPILSVFSDLKGVRTHLIKQYGDKLADYPTFQRLNATYLCPEAAEYLAQELSDLLPQVVFEVEGIYQIPGLIYYTAHLTLGLNREISGNELREMFSNLPRVMIADGQIISTYDIDYYIRSRLQMSGIGIPPIIIYSSELSPAKGQASLQVKIKLAIDYRLIAVLPNIDALRVLSLGQSPLAAMWQTDKLVAKLPF